MIDRLMIWAVGIKNSLTRSMHSSALVIIVSRRRRSNICAG